MAQWEFDSRLVAQALQSIAIAFPHYSLHDASHSRRIISYVGELLGERRVRQLSSATIWLIMSAAYYHDAGMIIPDRQGRTWWADAEFQRFLADAASNLKHPLHEEAKLLATIDVGGDEWPFDIRRAITVVVAEYGRQHHPARAVEVVTAPGTFGIDSPRANLIIPARIWRVLGRVCESHGRSFSDMMKLEKEANGVAANDKIHPRFVAAMLRLGDLLDLDNGRFCPTMSLTLGRIPHLSRVHADKHASIDHFLVRPDIIQVRASCKTDEREVYDETRRWLDMLERELVDQGRRWNEIAPVANFGALPSAGPPLTVSLPKSFHSVESNLSGATLTMASTEALELFRDAGIYANPGHDFVRELLQNAFDATLMRLQEEGFEPDALGGEPSERLRAVKRLLSHWPVRVVIERIGTRGSGDEETSTWRLTVADSGIGIGKEELEHVRTVGQSNQHKRRSGLPDWLLTSGEFGIGLQSAFYLTDKITLRSHDLRTRFACEIEMHEDGRFYVFEWTPPKYGYGTQLCIEFERPNVPSRVRVNPGTREEELLNDFDCVSDRTMPVDVVRIVDAIETYARGSVVPVEVMFDGRELDITQDEPPLLFSSNVGIRRLKLIVTGSPRWEHWYRGLYLSKAKDAHINGWAAWVAVDFDHYHGHSAVLLNLGRNAFREDRSASVDRLWRSAVAIIQYGHLRLDELVAQDQAVFCLIARLIEAVAKDEDTADAACRKWVDRAVEESEKLVARVAQGGDEWMRAIPIAQADARPATTLYDVRSSAYVWEAEGPSDVWHISPTRPTEGESTAPQLLKRVGAIAPLFRSLSVEPMPGAPERELFRLGFAPSECHGIGDEAMHLVFLRALKRLGWREVGFRSWTPLPPKYLALALEEGVKVWASRCFSYLRPTGPMGILPVRIEHEQPTHEFPGTYRTTISTPNLSDYVRWVHARRREQQIAVADVATATALLLEELHAFAEARDDVEQNFDLDKARAELGLLR